jgi:hypothetical protein
MYLRSGDEARYAHRSTRSSGSWGRSLVMRTWNTDFSFWEQQGMLKRIFLVGAVVGIALAHGIVLYKIDVGARSHTNDVKTVMVSRTRRALW